MTREQFVSKFKNNKTLHSPWLKNKLINCGIYMVGLIIVLFINYFSVLRFKASIWMVLDLFLMILAVSPIFFFKGTMFDRIYLPIIFFIVVALLTININYFKFFGVVFTIKDLKWALDNVAQAGVYFKELNWVITSINVILFLLVTASLLVFNIKFNFKETKTAKNPSRKTISILAGVVMASSLLAYEFTMGMWTISQKNRGVQSIKYVNYNSSYHFQQLGMMSFYNREIRQMMTDKGATNEQIESWLRQSYLVKDEFSGCLKNPNVFVIMIEMGDRVMLNEYTTPNLWKLFKSQGIWGEHNYSFNHTNVSNILGITGSYPLNPILQRGKYFMPFSLTEILNKNNYNSRFYYDIVESEDSYRDMKFSETLGFQNRLFHNELLPGVKPWTYWNSDFIRDSVVADAIVKDLTQFHEENPNTKIYSHWMTMHMHMKNVFTENNKELIQGLYDEFGSKLKTFESEGKWVNKGINKQAKEVYEIYTLKTMDFDKALGQIMSYFYDSPDPELNNTIMVAYGDHSWYEAGGGEVMAKQAKNIYDDEDLHLYSTTLGLYHPNLKDKIENDTTGLFNGHNLQKQTSPACIVPTILDLMGIPYIRSIYQDQSIFDLSKQKKYVKDYDEIYYSVWENKYFSEDYTSGNGGNITKVINDRGKSDLFMKKVFAKQEQLRVLDSIYHNLFFYDHNYDDYIPTTEFHRIANEVALVKYYE